MIPVACAVIHNFICINNPNDRLLQQYNLDGHTAHEIDHKAPRIHDDGDYDVPTDFLAPNLAADQDFMSTVRDDMANQMWVAFQQNPWYR